MQRTLYPLVYLCAALIEVEKALGPTILIYSRKKKKKKKKKTRDSNTYWKIGTVSVPLLFHSLSFCLFSSLSLSRARSLFLLLLLKRKPLRNSRLGMRGDETWLSTNTTCPRYFPHCGSADPPNSTCPSPLWRLSDANMIALTPMNMPLFATSYDRIDDASFASVSASYYSFTCTYDAYEFTRSGNYSLITHKTIHTCCSSMKL